MDVMNNTIKHLPGGDFSVVPLNDTCECCGVVDCELVQGLCITCANKFNTTMPTEKTEQAFREIFNVEVAA